MAYRKRIKICILIVVLLTSLIAFSWMVITKSDTSVMGSPKFKTNRVLR
jgi:hypothetical protein